MAAHYYGINRGDEMHAAVVQNSSPGKEVEIVINTAVSDRQTVVILLQQLTSFLMQKPYPPL